MDNNRGQSRFGWICTGIIIVSFLIISSPIIAYAGACSWHGGVSCSAGADKDGSVICSDGWRDSSVNYNSVSECSDCSSYLSHSGCKYQYEYDEIVSEIASRGVASSPFFMEPATRCKEEIKEYERKKINYEQCINLQGKALESSINKYQEEVKKVSCPTNSVLIGGNCQCNEGYVVDGSSCITFNQSCQSKYGFYSYGSKGYCYCHSGYEFNSNKTSCVKSLVCSLNSNKVGNSCICNEGYEWNSSKTSCMEKVVIPPPVKPTITKPKKVDVVEEKKEISIPPKKDGLDLGKRNLLGSVKLVIEKDLLENSTTTEDLKEKPKVGILKRITKWFFGLF